MGDGTFGRVLKCIQVFDKKGQKAKANKEEVYAVKVVRAVQRYTESAKFEA